MSHVQFGEVLQFQPIVDALLENRSIMADIEDSHEVFTVFPTHKRVSTFCDMVSQGVENLPKYFGVNNDMTPAEEQHDVRDWIQAGLHTLFPDPSKYEDVSKHHLEDPPPLNFCKLPNVHSNPPNLLRTRGMRA